MPTVLRLLMSLLLLSLCDSENMTLDRLVPRDLRWLVNLLKLLLIRTLCNEETVRPSRLDVSDELVLILIREVLSVVSVWSIFRVTLVVPLTWV